jgi:hypothetical protein
MPPQMQGRGGSCGLNCTGAAKISLPASPHEQEPCKGVLSSALGACRAAKELRRVGERLQ